MRITRLLLRAFPREFRARFGDDLAETVADRLAAARARGGLRGRAEAARVVLDVVGHGLSERRARRTGLPRRDLMLQTLKQDASYGWRTLRRAPGVTAAAVATFAIGLGASTAVFSVADALVLRPLPYPAANRLVALTDDNDALDVSVNVALPNFDDWRARVGAIDAAAAWQTADVNLVAAGGAEHLTGAGVTGDFFEIVGARPLAGRVLSPGATEAANAVVLSARVWRRLFGGRADAIGATAVLDGTAHEIVGVVPAVPGLTEIDVWRPLARTGAALRRTSHGYRAIARLRPGVTLAAARAEFDAVSAGLAAAHPDSNRDWHAGVTPLQTALGEDLGPVLRLVAWIAALLLLVACTNVAGLLVARASDRRRELAVRAALGAPRRRLMRQLLTESLRVSGAGTAAGVVLAVWGTSLVVGLLPEDVAPWRQPSLSPDVVLFAIAAALVTGLVTGLAPALAAIRPAAPDALRTGTATSTRAVRRLRHALVFVQVTAAVVLLTGASLLVVSLWRAAHVDPGFDPESALTFRVAPPRQTHPDAAALRLYYGRLLADVASLPQVEAAGAISGLPAAGNETISTVRRPDEPAPGRGEERWALHQVSTPGYLRASGTRLLAGRDFEAGDAAGASPVVIVNETLARELWPDQNPLGREVVLEPETRFRVVGLVADVRHFGLDQKLYRQYFVPLAQVPARSLSVVLRLRAPLAEPALRRVLAEVDPGVPPYAVRTLASVASGSLGSRRSLTGAAVVCGAAAVLLALVGLAGVVASAVRDRRREIGIRLALGAAPRWVVRRFVGRATLLAGTALVAGLVASWWVAASIEPFLFGVEPLDPGVAGTAAALLVVATVAASWLAARPASRVDPLEALRTE